MPSPMRETSAESEVRMEAGAVAGLMHVANTFVVLFKSLLLGIIVEKILELHNPKCFCRLLT